MTSTAAAVLQERLGLSEDELLQILDVDPLTLLGGELGHRPEVGILLALTDGIDTAVLRRWLRANDGRPLRLLLARDFAAFEDAVEDLRERGLILRGGGGA
ncbi:MAG: hypothetical protein HZB46_12430 [Solirubrobacterales bacterium]|nr:hypothetical protein [Solirubrobacterales bacterium]